MTDSLALPDDTAQARANIARLTVAQALAGANSTIVYAAGSIVGDMLAPSHLLATLPVSVFVVGMAAGSLPAGAVAQRWGRRAAFLAGTGSGMLAGALAALAIVQGLFWLFCVATFFGGGYAAVVFSYRFAAADCVSVERRPRALSFVMAGGIFAGVIGPQIVTHTMRLWAPYLFAASFVAQAAVAALAAVIVAGVRLPRPPRQQQGGGRPLRAIVRQPRFITAVVCGTVSYVLMNLLMTAAPLAMHLCGLSQGAADLGIQWHVIAMYGPSFFTGRLITRFGARKVVGGGLALITAAALIGMGGIDVGHFWLALVFLGAGWNFGFVGASALVLECHLPQEKARVQAFNDFVVFSTVALGSLVSGGVVTAFGWDAVLWLVFPPVAVAVLALALTARTSGAYAPG